MVMKACDWCDRTDKGIKEYEVVLPDHGCFVNTRMINICSLCDGTPFLYVDKDKTIKIQYKNLTM